MQDWTKAAGLPPGHTLHGLRKTLGKMLAEHGATTRQIMAILGHDDIAHAELYTREADQRVLAADGMEKLRAPNLRAIKGGKADG
jgi:integrase